MPDQNLGQLALLTAAQVETAADRLCVWDNSATGAARTKGMLFSQLLAWIGTNLGGKRHTRSFSEPSSKSVGDTWEELDESGGLRYGWAWWWDETYWKSPDQYFAASLIGAKNEFQPIIPSFHIWIKNVVVQAYIDTPQNASNKWIIALDKHTAANAVTNLGTIDGTTLTAGQWNYSGFTVNQMVRFSEGTSLITLYSQGFGTPGSLFAGAQAAYNIVRI